MSFEDRSSSLVENLIQAGQVVDSAVGGEKCYRRGGTSVKRSVAFWGICDIKYDPRLPEQERVKVLELGDGKSSRFSHHGRPIKEKFDTEYCMDKNPPPIKRAVLVENKKFTHDMFVKEGFPHLRPATVSFPRSYKPELAAQILQGLNADESNGVVLKLCNRSRGAGIVVVRGNREELDEKLKLLLHPISNEELLEAFPELVGKAMSSEPQDPVMEQCLHWWSNECPVFIAERLCRSIPVAKQPGSDQKFDGTMRVAFALHRKQAVNKLSHMAQVPEVIKPFEIDWLGGYWKLPKATTGEGQAEGKASSLHDQLVSSFNSVDKRTAEVPQEHLDEIYEALTPALPVIFHTGALGVTMIQSLYKGDRLFESFALARVAAAMRASEMVKAKDVYDLARRAASKASQPDEDLAKRSLLSYLARNEGVCEAMWENWEEAGRKFSKAVEHLHTNATAYYLLGCYHQEKGELLDASRYYYGSVGLDPDFKAPFLAIGNCDLLMGRFESAINAGAACLRRNPDAPQAQFLIGQAIYHMLFLTTRPQGQQAAEVREKAVAALEIAKARMPSSWTEADENMLAYLVADEASRHARSKMPVHVWKIPGWRP